MSIEYRIAKSNDRGEIVKLSNDHFYPYEPMNLGWITEGSASTEDLDLSLEDLDKGHCIVAVDTETNTIVGASCNAVDRPGSIDAMYKDAELTNNSKWAEYLRFYAELDELAGIFKKYEVDASFHVHCLVVNAEYRKRSIGLNLISETHQLGAELGYKISTINCSSYFTAQIAKQLQMEKICEMAYDDIEGKNGQKLIRSSPPHTHFVTYAIKLPESAK